MAAPLAQKTDLSDEEIKQYLDQYIPLLPSSEAELCLHLVFQKIKSSQWELVDKDVSYPLLQIIFEANIALAKDRFKCLENIERDLGNEDINEDLIRLACIACIDKECRDFITSNYFSRIVEGALRDDKWILFRIKATGGVNPNDNNAISDTEVETYSLRVLASKNINLQLEVFAFLSLHSTSKQIIATPSFLASIQPYIKSGNVYALGIIENLATILDKSTNSALKKQSAKSSHNPRIFDDTDANHANRVNHILEAKTIHNLSFVKSAIGLRYAGNIIGLCEINRKACLAIGAQGGVPILLRCLTVKGDGKERQDITKEDVDKQSYILARLLIHMDPNTLFTRSLPAISVIGFLLKLLDIEEYQQAGLMALTNLATMPDETIHKAITLKYSVIDDLLIQHSADTSRAAIQLVCNLTLTSVSMKVPWALSMYMDDNIKRVNILIALTGSEDREVVKASLGTLSAIVILKDVAIRVLQKVESILSTLEDGDAEIDVRAKAVLSGCLYDQNILKDQALSVSNTTQSRILTALQD